MAVTPGSDILVSDIINGTAVYAADAGASDAYAISLPTSPGSYVTGAVFHFKANTVNTGAATLNVNSLGAKTIKKNYDQDLNTGDIKANQLVSVIYDGTNFQMLSHPSNAMSSIAVGNTTKDTSTTATTTIAHGLGVVPKIVRMQMNTAVGGLCVAHAMYLTATGAQPSNTCFVDASSGTDFGATTTFAVYENALNDGLNGTITVDATNITITWADVGGGAFTGTAYIIWEAQS